MWRTPPIIVNHRIVSWGDVERSVDVMCKKISLLGRTFPTISTAGRGGLVVSRLAADRLDVERITMDDERIESDMLFVDDIFDTGRTMQDVLTRAGDPSGLVFAVPYARRMAEYPRQLIFGEEIRDESYLVFPWDRLEFQRRGGSVQHAL